MIELLASSLRLSTPLLFAAMGGCLAERSGIATICLEGVLLLAAFSSAAAAYASGQALVGLVAGLFAGMAAMSLHAFLVEKLKAQPIVSGVIVNLLAAGIPPLLSHAWFTSSTNTPSLDQAARMNPWHFGFFPEPLRPLVDQVPLVFLALALPFVVHYLLYRTGLGLRILAAGDGPEALTAQGVNVTRIRMLALALAGIVTSLGGTFLAIGHASQFTRDMTAGRGFIALAALIFGKWRPLPTLASCLLFGFADALQIQLQSQTILGGYHPPIQLVQAFPYLITLFVLVAFAGGSRPPRAVAQG